MNLYKLTQDINTGYDTYDACIVAAESAEEAEKINPSPRYKWLKTEAGEGWHFLYDDGRVRLYKDDSWTNPSDITCTLIGTAIEGTPSGLILASFNAG